MVSWSRRPYKYQISVFSFHTVQSSGSDDLRQSAEFTKIPASSIQHPASSIQHPASSIHPSSIKHQASNANYTLWISVSVVQAPSLLYWPRTSPTENCLLLFFISAQLFLWHQTNGNWGVGSQYPSSFLVQWRQLLMLMEARSTGWDRVAVNRMKLHLETQWLLWRM